MEAWLKDLLVQIDASTHNLITTARGLTDDQVRQPSLLPGWTRGHVLTHIARAAEAHRNLLESARNGAGIPAYESQQARDTAIETGARRPVAEQVADIRRTAGIFRAEVDLVPDDAWATRVTILHLPPFPASQVVLRKLVELELHHVDLDAGYSPSDWPGSFSSMELPQPMRDQAADRIRWFSQP